LEKTKKILVTGAAGFIGFHLCKRLIDLGYSVVGLDNINDYYQVSLKYARLQELGISAELAEVFSKEVSSSTYKDSFRFVRMNLEDREALPKLFEQEQFDIVCNLAAQAGVRYSLENPQAYIDSNIQGFLNILECCRHHEVKKLVYASSSSVYGNNESVPFKETDNVDYPISLYAATKKLMAHTYSHLYGIQTIGLRFFTVYGPWGRPDMAMFLFTDAILNDREIKVFNEGNLARDFTYIDDIVEGVVSTITQKAKNNERYQLFNIGNNSPVKLMDFISQIEKCLGRIADKKLMPMQDGDVYITYADTSHLSDEYDYKPNTPIAKGITEFVSWYQNFYAL
jgi:UDP-glucuronate 4-epimerase